MNGQSPPAGGLAPFPFVVLSLGRGQRVWWAHLPGLRCVCLTFFALWPPLPTREMLLRLLRRVIISILLLDFLKEENHTDELRSQSNPPPAPHPGPGLRLTLSPLLPEPLLVLSPTTSVLPNPGPTFLCPLFAVSTASDTGHAVARPDSRHLRLPHYRLPRFPSC